MRVGYTEVPAEYVLAFVVGLIGVLYFLIQLLRSLFGGEEEKKQKFNVCELCFDVLGDELGREEEEEEDEEEGEEEVKEEEVKEEGWGGVVETRRERERRMRKQRGVVTRGAYVQWLLGEEVISQKISLKEGFFSFISLSLMSLPSSLLLTLFPYFDSCILSHPSPFP